MATREALDIHVSELDSLRFGVLTGRAAVSDSSDVARCDDYCRTNGVQLLILRCSTSDIEIVHALETGGGHLMECQVCYRRDLHRYPYESDTSALDWIRDATLQDADAIASVARQAFATYRGHYRADPHLDRGSAVQAYRDWAGRLCAGNDVAHKIFAAWQGDTIAGFAIMRLNSPDETEMVLGAVVPEKQGLGIPYALGHKIFQWSTRAGARSTIIWTHVRNITLQRAMIRHNGVPVSSRYIMHKWYDR